jgi:type II secretory pathway component PulF
MIGAGEKSGKLPEVFLHIGRLFEEEADLTAKNLTILLEPILLVLVWLGVMGVAIAVILPLYSVLSGIN